MLKFSIDWPTYLLRGLIPLVCGKENHGSETDPPFHANMLISWEFASTTCPCCRIIGLEILLLFVTDFSGLGQDLCYLIISMVTSKCCYVMKEKKPGTLTTGPRGPVWVVIFSVFGLPLLSCVNDSLHYLLFLMHNTHAHVPKYTHFLLLCLVNSFSDCNIFPPRTDTIRTRA